MALYIIKRKPPSHEEYKSWVMIGYLGSYDRYEASVREQIGQTIMIHGDLGQQGWHREGMMGQVFVTTYELVGDAVQIGVDHYAAVEAARTAGFALAKQFGAEGFRPTRRGGHPLSMFFRGDLPTGWRKIGRADGLTEARPNKGTKAGKAAQAQMQACASAPEDTALASALGYNPSEIAMDTNRGVIYFPTSLRVDHPSARYFVRIPRFDRDDFKPDKSRLRAIPESELMRALEEHNAEVLRQNERAVA